ncbi:potassium channel family protein [Salipiger sp. P9]|uniref:potassium channel family protein n=1 Tax=Salipiger pentaromativorans TaxID=2943193 RepID=UPI0021583374|nr:potassium channel family protein [Salipiger pentaromativorans]MCR8549694.1 potassium channel family protein [Salipiger pentaromativorans]
MKRLRILTLVATVLGIIALGTVYFRLVEGWSWLDSYFFTVVTLSTVGYGNHIPITVAGKIGTTVFILLGLGIFAVAVQQFGLFAMRKREEHTEWLIAKLDLDKEAANEDAPASQQPEPPANRD